MSDILEEIKTVRKHITCELEKNILDKETVNQLTQNIDKLTELSKEGQWLDCKQALMDSIQSEKLHAKTGWRLFVKVQGVRGQTQNLENWEKDMIRFLRHEMKFSYNSIGEIMARSKETVYKHAGVDEN